MSLTPDDEARLRGALRTIGGSGGQLPAQKASQWRRPLLPAMACLAAAAAFGGLFFAAVQFDPAPENAGSGSSVGGQTTEEGIACASLILIGTVEQVEDRGDTVRVRGRVEEWLKPSRSAKSFNFVTRDPTLEGKGPLQLGQRVLAFVPANLNLAVDVFDGRSIVSMRKVVNSKLPAAQRIECPGKWATRGPL